MTISTDNVWVPVQDEETPANSKGLQICEAHKCKRYVDTERNPKLQCQQKCKETKLILKQWCQKTNSRAIILIM